MTDSRQSHGTWEAMLRQTYQGIDLKVEDLYLLEAYSLEQLPDRVTPRALAAVLHAHPTLSYVWSTRCPTIKSYLGAVVAKFAPADEVEKDTLEDSVVWEIAELLVYHRDPQQYEERVAIDWQFDELTREAPIEDRVIVDVGAGTGRIAFQAASLARWVFAIEPVSSLRRYILEKCRKNGVANVYVLDGILAGIPLPDGFVDVLATCQAFGWSLAEELTEIQRVVRPGGVAVHMSGLPVNDEGSIHQALISDQWGYHCREYLNCGQPARMYVRRFP